MYGQVFFIALTLLAAMATAVVYGLGGTLIIHGVFQLGTLVALTALLGRVYGPITSLSNVQVNVMTALVSFDRVFEVLDLKPLIEEKPDAVAMPRTMPLDGTGAAPDIEFDDVSFRYPSASEVSLASLESIALPVPERTGRRAQRAQRRQLPRAVRPADRAGRAVRRREDDDHQPGRPAVRPDAGAVRIGGYDLRDVTLESLHDAVGVVTQDAHLFHDTLRANLMYARPTATEAEVIEACRAAQIWELIASLPDGLDTVVGDRGYRLSGGEKQRVALARLLLKAPAVVVLDEATAHLDSESEAAVQRALKTALAGRTSLVIAHRLSTIRDADQILVIDDGPGHRARHPRGTARRGRPVRRAVPHAVRDPGGGPGGARGPPACARARSVVRRRHTDHSPGPRARVGLWPVIDDFAVTPRRCSQAAPATHPGRRPGIALPCRDRSPSARGACSPADPAAHPGHRPWIAGPVTIRSSVTPRRCSPAAPAVQLDQRTLDSA